MSIHNDPQTIHSRLALLPEGWASDVRVTLSAGRIAAVKAGVERGVGDTGADVLLPAPGNLHSHTFQRAMAGLTEHRGKSPDSFWTWRAEMYRFLDLLSPDDIEAIAAMAFCEMLEQGFGAVAEFHYLHNQVGGIPYVTPSELSFRIMSAAGEAGIGLTHLPVLYTFGGAGRQPLAGGQLRFRCDPESFARILADVRAAAARGPDDLRIGIAPHSLRATCPEDLAAVLPLAGDGPIHMHLSEQPKEVSDVEGWLGARPVAWMLANMPVGPDWCAIHATHMTDAEARGLAAAGAVAGLCPVTEANLGDGIFDGPRWIAAGGVFGVGTDSNIRISMADELCALEYSQRLRDIRRNVMIPGEGSVGAFLFRAAARGAAQALGRPSGEVWSAGRHVVREGRHVARDRIAARYRAAIRQLMAAA